MCATSRGKLVYAKPSFEKVYELGIKIESGIRSIDKAEVDTIKKYYAVDENIKRAIRGEVERTEERREEMEQPSEDELRERFNKVARDSLLFRQRKKIGLI